MQGLGSPVFDDHPLGAFDYLYDPAIIVSVSLEAKLAAAKDYLGKRWVHHPDYQFDPRHSNDPDVYEEARLPYLAHVREIGRIARETNKFFPRLCRSALV